MFFNLYLYSNNQKSLEHFILLINKLNRNNDVKLKFFSVQSQKLKKKKRFTVLKSPHVNKKAQEHFEYNIYSRQLSFYSFQTKKLIFILKKIQTQLFSDLHIKIKITLIDYKLLEKRSLNVHPKRFILFLEKKQKNYNTKAYLKILDTFGEFNFKSFL